ncbi:glycosyltransferase [Legionella sp. PATHC035]|uniref:glycosyltransferase n=1 Tax=Legionella sp. PATHC035 TaxID=2992040 RepID=UPI002243C95D|nr:glycosyltransferase [Legionella sp. PATHC035]MCW8409264.1 glycosyltransferase [Legionella sp. PATHC035]
MVVIPNGFDFDHFNAQRIARSTVRNELGLHPSELLIGCVGRFHPDKGHDTLIKAVALLRNRKDQKIRFLLVGRDCEQNNLELMSLLNSLELTALFILLGERTDIPECLAAMDIFCMPSRKEGFPNGLGEAMSMGLPCVATDVGDVHVLVEDTALLVAPDDPEALARGLTEMIEMDPDQRKMLGQKALMRVHSKFSLESVHERFYALYKELSH